MRLERAIITDFRQYYGEQTITFATDDQRNVTVLHGVNGAGKTSLFTALNWCLYGEGAENIGQIISKEAVLRAAVGEEVISKVVVVFTHDGQRYRASRLLKGIKQADGSVQALPTMDLLLSRTSYDGQSKTVSNPIGTMNAILPANVRSYFFFDGEKIDNFARPEAAGEVQTAIFQVLNLEVLTRARDHLEKEARELRRELKAIAGKELQGLLDKQETDLKRKTDLQAQQQQLRNEMTAARQHIQDINRRLGELQESQALQHRYDQFSDEMKERDKALKGLTERIRQIATQGYVMLIGDAVSRAQQVLDDKRQRGEIPGNIRQQFVQDLLDRHECLCGRPFSDNDDVHQRLVALLHHSLPGALEDDVQTTSGILRTLPDRATSMRHDLATAMQERVQLQHRMEELYRQRDDIARQMGDSKQDEVSMLSKRRDEYQADLEKYQDQLSRTTMELEQLEPKLADLKQQIAKAEKEAYRERLLSRKAELAQQSADAIEQMFAVFADAKRQQIEARARAIFQQLAWKGDHFRDLSLSADYQLEVTDRYGQPARSELSAGERQVLSLSFITAMAQVSGREAPLVLDTPFGRLSSNHREKITANLPALASQLVLFVTDEELHDQARINLQPRIGTEYKLCQN